MTKFNKKYTILDKMAKKTTSKPSETDTRQVKQMCIEKFYFF